MYTLPSPYTLNPTITSDYIRAVVHDMDTRACRGSFGSGSAQGMYGRSVVGLEAETEIAVQSWNKGHKLGFRV